MKAGLAIVMVRLQEPLFSEAGQWHSPRRSFVAARRGLFIVGLLALLLASAAGAAGAAKPAESTPTAEREATKAYGLFPLRKPDEDPTEYQILAPNQPMYFVVGGSGDTTARFQFSFQYRLFDEDSAVVQWVPWIYGLHFGYTQTSLWNLSEDSIPFEDTSYKPSLFWQVFERREGLLPDAWRTGFQHKSNGRAGEQSRSINTLFVHPGWFFSPGRYQLLVAPKLYVYLTKGDNNRDIADYRGYVSLLARVGRSDGWQVSARIRSGKDGYGSTQIDISYPLRDSIAMFAGTGGFLYIQFFQGYGLTLLNYDRREDLQAWVGFAIVR